MRLATRHDCLATLLGDGDKKSEIMCDEGKIFCTGPTRAAKAGQKFSNTGMASQRNNQGRTLFICTLLHESPFASVSTVSRGPPLSGLSGHKIHRYKKADLLFSEVELGEMMVYADMVEAVDPSLVATYTKTR
jgi:hypothetical protein